DIPYAVVTNPRRDEIDGRQHRQEIGESYDDAHAAAGVRVGELLLPLLLLHGKLSEIRGLMSVDSRRLASTRRLLAAGQTDVVREQRGVDPGEEANADHETGGDWIRSARDRLELAVRQLRPRLAEGRQHDRRFGFALDERDADLRHLVRADTRELGHRAVGI